MVGDHLPILLKLQRSLHMPNTYSLHCQAPEIPGSLLSPPTQHVSSQQEEWVRMFYHSQVCDLCKHLVCNLHRRITLYNPCIRVHGINTWHTKTTTIHPLSFHFQPKLLGHLGVHYCAMGTSIYNCVDQLTTNAKVAQILGLIPAQ